MPNCIKNENRLKVPNDSKYKLIFSIHQHPFLGVMIHPYVIAYTSTNTLSLTYQKVFSGNASYYDQISENELNQIALLDPLMVENIIRKFSPKKKIRPKEYFQKHFDKEDFKEKIRPYMDRAITAFFEGIDESNNQLYEADEINPAAKQVTVQDEFTKVLFHFRKNENGTSYFVTLKHKEERIPFMKQGGMLLSASPARILVHQKIYKFYDFVDGTKIGLFLNRKYIHVKPENEHTYYTKFVRPLLETAPVQVQGFEIETRKDQATPCLLLTQKNDEFGFSFQINYAGKSHPYHSNKLFHVELDWANNRPQFKRYKRSSVWESNKYKLLLEHGLIHREGSFFSLPENSLIQCINWIREHHDVLLENHFLVQSKLEETYSIEKPTLKYNVTEKIDWFDLKIILSVGGAEIPFDTIVKQMKKGKRELVLPNGQVFLFPEEWFALGTSLFSTKSVENQYSIKKYELNILNHIKSPAVKKHLNGLVEYKKVSPNKHFKGKLRPYQVEGLSWLVFLKNNQFGGILADDMGLGKTVQALAFLQKVIASTRPSSPSFLLVAPTSLLYNWQHECNTFTPNLRVCIHTGSKRHTNIQQFNDADLIITSYGLIRNDHAMFEQMSFEVILLDESQNIKNYSAKTTQCINKLNAKCRVALTGTPIENTIKDLWSQMNFLNKGLLGSLTAFNENFAKPIEKEDDPKKIQQLKQLINPFLLRRTKEEVAKDLPNLQEKIVYCEMTEAQAKYYEEVKSSYRNELLKSMENETFKTSKLSVLQGLSRLRQIANHPSMVDETYTNDSGKHELLLEKIHRGIADGHKILVFSQFVTYLEIIEKSFIERNTSYFKLTGATPKKNRQKDVTKFQHFDKPCVFLISLKAGGVGLNLTAADYVFIADPWWNPAAEAQARDRSHRIGQNQPVFSYRFISRNTIEEKIAKLQSQKKKFSSELIQSESNMLQRLNPKDLKFLLD